MPSATRTSCRSASTTSTPSSCPRASLTSRCRRSTPSARCWRRSGCARSSLTRWSISIRRRSEPSDYSLGGKRVAGFNALFATASIEAAKRYYAEFASQQEDLPPDRRLKIGLIYSYAANEAIDDDYLDKEEFETVHSTRSSRDFLEDAIQDYNDMFGTSFDTSADKFQNYYKDLSLRLKSREIDLVIVVNMFLTGFDATTLNTLVGRQEPASRTAFSRPIRGPTASSTP